MSVRNILDGTIPVGGGVIPEDLSVNTLSATDEITTQYLAVGSMARFLNGMRIGGTLKVENSQVDQSLGTIETPSLTATGTIHADNEITAPGVSATLFSGGSFKGSNVDAGFITAENWIKTPALQVNGTQVLTPTDSDSNQSISVTYSDGSTGTPTAQVHSKVSNINNEQHVLTCQTTLTSLSKAIKQMIIPTGLDFTGRQTVSHNTTVALINNTDLLLGMVHIYVESNQLMARVVFSETPSYTSMLIRINIVFN